MTATYGFATRPQVFVDADGKSFEMVRDNTYYAKLGDSWLIPAGFKTDFATIPAFVSWAVAKLGAYTLAAIVHDLLCEGLNSWYRARRHGGIPTRGGHPCLLHQGRVVPAPTANAVDTDAIFYRIARDHGVDPVTANLLWVGVRWGALANPARREGWLKTAPAVLGLSLLYAPVLLPASIFVLAGRGVLRVARFFFRGRS